MSDSSDDKQVVRVIRDESGLLFLGDDDAIKPWLDDQGLKSRELTRRALAKAGAAGQAAVSVAEASGRWVKLTDESAKLLKRYAEPGKLQYGVARGSNKQVVKWLQFETPADLFTPAAAGGIAGMMTQMALEQAIEEITEYLKAIDAKVDELLQDQKDRAIAELAGAALEVDEAMAIRDATGSLGPTAWSKVAPCAKVTGTAQVYALTKLKGIADKLDAAAGMDEIESATAAASKDTSIWLAVIARAIQTRDKLSVVELESVYGEDPALLEEHRLGIVEARRHRLEAVRTGILAYRSAMESAADRARDKKPLHPFAADRSIEELDLLVREIGAFAERLDIAVEDVSIERAKRWDIAVGDAIGEAAEDVAEFGGRMVRKTSDLREAIADGAGDAACAVQDAAEVARNAAHDAANVALDKAAGFGAAAAEQADKVRKRLKDVDIERVTKDIPRARFPRRRS